MHTYAPIATHAARDLTVGQYVWTSRGWCLVVRVDTDAWLTTVVTSIGTFLIRPHERMDVRDYYEGGE